MNITAITCAVWRPEAWALCEKYVARQTQQPFQWLVLDDDEKRTVCTQGQEYHHWPECRGQASLVLKLRRAFKDKLIKGDGLVFIENDDWYASDYIAWCAAGLEKHGIYGEGRALYYNVQHRYWFEHANIEHASLCSTAIRCSLFDYAFNKTSRTNNPFIDVDFWNRPPEAGCVVDPRTTNEKRRLIGIKAMPGRQGYGGGHRGRDSNAKDDLALEKLFSLIGDDAENYRQFCPDTPTASAVISVPQNTTTETQLIARSDCGRAHGPNWAKWIGAIKDDLTAVGLEIGTFEGDSAEWMAENIFTKDTQKYICVDTFEGSQEHKDAGINMSATEKIARNKLGNFKNVEIIKGMSHDVLRKISHQLSFVYVDGDHTARGALRDAVLAFDLMRIGGVMVFDDYEWDVMPDPLDRPKTAIDAFLNCYSRQIEVLQGNGWQVAIRKVK